jgi:hypothetical protein
MIQALKAYKQAQADADLLVKQPAAGIMEIYPPWLPVRPFSVCYTLEEILHSARFGRNQAHTKE